MRAIKRQLRHIICGLSLASFLSGFTSAAQDSELTPPSLWLQSHEIRTWSGYKDNVLLGHRNTVGSPLVAGGLDLMFFRLPAEGWEYMFLGSAEYTHYFAAGEVEREATAFVHGQVKRTFADGWRSGLSGDYFYFDQVFDSTVYQEEPGAIHVQGHSFVARPSAGKDLGGNYSLDFELPVTRQVFAEIIDDYWELGPKLILARRYGRKSSFSGSYQLNQRWHDTRERRDAHGQIEQGDPLEFTQHEIALHLRHFWGSDQRWRAVTRLSFQRNLDNGGGYYDYVRPQISEQIRFQAEGWAASVEGRLSHYSYDRQRIADSLSAKRDRTLARVILRGEKSLSSSWKTFAQYEHEKAWSNLQLESYTAHTVLAGISLEF
jgi:hypothetical protein